MASCASIPVNSTKQLPQLILKRIIQTTGLIFYDECFRNYEYRCFYNSIVTKSKMAAERIPLVFQKRNLYIPSDCNNYSFLSKITFICIARYSVSKLTAMPTVCLSLI